MTQTTPDNKVLLIGDNFRLTIEFSNILRKNGFRVHVAGWLDLSLQKSKHIEKYYSWDIMKSVKEYINKLRHIIKENNYTYVIPVNDGALDVCRIASHDIRKYSELLGLPDSEQYMYSNNRFILNKKLQEMSFPAPASFIIKSIDEFSKTNTAFPCIAKPVSSWKIFNDALYFLLVIKINSRDEINKIEENITKSEIIIQEYISGEEIGYNFFAINGEVIQSYFDKQIHGFIGFESSYRKIIPADKTLEEQAKRLIKEIKWTGLGMFDIRVNETGGYIIELNGRPWTSIALGRYANRDMLQLFIDHFVFGKEYTSPGKLKMKRIRNLKLDFKYALHVLRGKEYKKFIIWIFELFLIFSPTEKMEDNLFNDFRFQLSLAKWHLKNLFTRHS